MGLIAYRLLCIDDLPNLTLETLGELGRIASSKKFFPTPS